MNFTSYADFRSRVQRVLDGDDSASSLSTALVNDMIGLAESRIYRESRNYLTEIASLRCHLGGRRTLHDLVRSRPLMSIRTFRLIHAGRTLAPRLGGRSRMRTRSAQAGNTLKLWPVAVRFSQGRTTASYRPVDDVSAFFTKYPDLFFFSTLSEGSSILADPRATMWEAKYRNILSRVNNERHAAYEGSRLMVRPR
jgi:hypothetical protein